MRQAANRMPILQNSLPIWRPASYPRSSEPRSPLRGPRGSFLSDSFCAQRARDHLNIGPARLKQVAPRLENDTSVEFAGKEMVATTCCGSLALLFLGNLIFFLGMQCNAQCHVRITDSWVKDPVGMQTDGPAIASIVCCAAE